MSPEDSSDSTDTARPPAPMPQRIGDYRIVRKLGEGGVGIVYEATQQNPKRPVALKVIREGRRAVSEAEPLEARVRKIRDQRRQR